MIRYNTQKLADDFYDLAVWCSKGVKEFDLTPYNNARNRILSSRESVYLFYERKKTLDGLDLGLTNHMKFLILLLLEKGFDDAKKWMRKKDYTSSLEGAIIQDNKDPKFRTISHSNFTGIDDEDPSTDDIYKLIEEE